MSRSRHNIRREEYIRISNNSEELPLITPTKFFNTQEIQFNILSYMGATEKFKMRKVSKNWREILKKNILWSTETKKINNILAKNDMDLLDPANEDRSEEILTTTKELIAEIMSGNPQDQNERLARRKNLKEKVSRKLCIATFSSAIVGCAIIAVMFITTAALATELSKHTKLSTASVLAISAAILVTITPIVSFLTACCCCCYSMNLKFRRFVLHGLLGHSSDPDRYKFGYSMLGGETLQAEDQLEELDEQLMPEALAKFS